MNRDIQDIPPAVRRPRWASVQWIRWPLALVGTAMVVLGGVWAGVLFLGSLGGQAGDARLDRAATVEAGRVESVEGSRFLQGVEWTTVRYRIDRDPQRVQQCMIPAPGPDAEPWAAGMECAVELLAAEPHINRIQGGRRSVIPSWAQPQIYLGLLVFPGFLLLCLWLQGIVDARRLLGRGDVSVGEILAVRRLRWIAPAMLVVTYRFRDHRAQVRTGQHWVRARSPLGRRIFDGEDRLPVVVHRRWPRQSRLVVPADFTDSRHRIPDAFDGASAL